MVWYLFLFILFNSHQTTVFLPVEHRSYNRVFKIISTILKPHPPPLKLSSEMQKGWRSSTFNIQLKKNLNCFIFYFFLPTVFWQLFSRLLFLVFWTQTWTPWPQKPVKWVQTTYKLGQIWPILFLEVWKTGLVAPKGPHLNEIFL